MPEPTEVAVVLIARNRDTRHPAEPEYLLAWNPKWEGFTFPMTKRRSWNQKDGRSVQENWLDTAGRAAFEYLGRSSTPRPALQNTVEVTNSGRDGELRVYHYHVFTVDFTETDRLTTGVPCEWHTAEELRSLHPITETARHIAGLTYIP